MTKRKINVLDYSSEILKALSKGILLTVKGEEKYYGYKLGCFGD